MNNVILLIIISAFAGGSNAPLAKVALESFQPFSIIFIRFLSASLILLPFIRANGELNRKVFQQVRWVAIIGACNPILLFIALQFTQASVSPLIYGSVPLMTTIYLQQFRSAKITAEKIVGIVVGFIGVAVIILLPLFQEGNLDLNSLGGNLLIFGAAIAFMFYGVFSKDKQRQYGVSPLALTFYFSITSLVISIPFALFEISSEPINLSALPANHILAALGTGVFGTSLFYLAYQKAIHLGNELTASLYTYLQPVATILYSVILLGEKITIPFLVGGTLAIIGAGMASVKNNNSK
jgi:drug/metabolite transporter (DMT)-like permease